MKELFETIKKYPIVFIIYTLLAIICWFIPVKLEIPMIIALFGIINTGLSDDVVTISALRNNKNKDEYIKNKEILSTMKVRLNNFNYILSFATILGLNLHKYAIKSIVFFPLLLISGLAVGSVILERFELFVFREFKNYFS